MHQSRLQGSRQEIKFVEDTKESKHNTNEDNTVNEDIEAVKEKKKQYSDYGNNYVTIIENNGDNVDTDSHNILSSELAKCLYTNVESSINMLENKESEMLAQEANVEMGALTISDTKVHQIVADETNAQEKSMNHDP